MFVLVFIGCAKPKQAVADIVEITEFGNELTGTVWIGQRTIQTDEFSGTTGVILTFLNEHAVEILEWEIIKPAYNYIYDYEISESVVSIYRTEAEYHDSPDEYVWETVRREYPAIIEKDTMTFPNWFGEGSIFLEKRTDLSGSGDIIIINGTYYENSSYFVRIEYKLLSDSVHGLELFIKSEKNTVSHGIRAGMANPGYRRTVLSFPENKVREYEADILRKLIFDYTQTGTYTEKDKEEYLQKYGSPELSYVWAMLYQNHTGRTFAESNIIKFK